MGVASHGHTAPPHSSLNFGVQFGVSTPCIYPNMSFPEHLVLFGLYIMHFYLYKTSNNNKKNVWGGVRWTPRCGVEFGVGLCGVNSEKNVGWYGWTPLTLTVNKAKYVIFTSSELVQDSYTERENE